MGLTGTEDSNNAASLILADDNFSTIVKAITIGRNIYRNIKNSIGFLLSGNMAAILAVVFASFANFCEPEDQATIRAPRLQGPEALLAAMGGLDPEEYLDSVE